MVSMDEPIPPPRTRLLTFRYRPLDQHSRAALASKKLFFASHNLLTFSRFNDRKSDTSQEKNEVNTSGGNGTHIFPIKWYQLRHQTTGTRLDIEV